LELLHILVVLEEHKASVIVEVEDFEMMMMMIMMMMKVDMNFRYSHYSVLMMMT